jgi:Ca2+-binding RTX toxin-like protein
VHFIERPRAHHRQLDVVGSNADDSIALRLDPRRTNVLLVDVGDDGTADFRVHLESISAINVDAGAGDDIVRIDDSNGAFTTAIRTRIAGGDGNDTLLGGLGSEQFVGGAGNDLIDGNGGADTADLGSGDDRFVWDPGDGSDTIEGRDGSDTMVFNGADAAERVSLLANGNRLRFLRDANVTMDTAGVETVDFNALGGSDVVSVDDLSGTDVSAVNVDLAGTLGGTSGDGQPDRVTVNATNGDDRISVNGNASGVTAAGLHTEVAIRHQESTDELDVHGLGGNDAISATALAAQTIALTLDGGADNDTLAGGQGIETLIGGDGNDTADGNGGNDAALLGAGDDTFVWDPGDGSDTIEGGDGSDTMVFNGANANEQVDLSANGNRLRFFRTQANITMDTAGVETVDFNALGGADLVTVNDLSGTDVRAVNVDLAGTLGGTSGDGQPDRMVLNSTNGDDTIRVNGDAGGVRVKGLAPAVEILHPEAANDRLEINTLAGNDTVDSGGLAAGAIQLFVDGLLVP